MTIYRLRYITLWIIIIIVAPAIFTVKINCQVSYSLLDTNDWATYTYLYMSPKTSGELARNLPEIIQGGMGIAVSNWKLAGKVAAAGELGIVSGTVISVVLARRLQEGDEGGIMREALEDYPDHETADGIIKTYFQPSGHEPGKPYKAVPMIDGRGHSKAEKLNMVASFAEVKAAQNYAIKTNGQAGKVGVNFLTKLQPPTLSGLWGAMLAGADCIIMGAGIPEEIPKALDDLAKGNKATIRLDVTGSKNKHNLVLDPENYPLLRDFPKSRPAFLAIVASTVLAKWLARKDVPPDGFVIEGPTAGGHNAPPRDRKPLLDERGQPIYNEHDEVDLNEVAKLGLPFWLAGSYGTPEGLQRAAKEAASGIQAGSAFALCQDSGLSPKRRQELINLALNGGIDIYTDLRASPTGYPFKVPTVKGTLSEPDVYEVRERVCDLGFLREAYAIQEPDGTETVGYRCASEPVEAYLKKGGELAATIGRKCLCNGLMAAIDLGQYRSDDRREDPILTLGDNANEAAQRIVPIFGREFSAANVISYIRDASLAR